MTDARARLFQFPLVVLFAASCTGTVEQSGRAPTPSQGQGQNQPGQPTQGSNPAPTTPATTTPPVGTTPGPTTPGATTPGATTPGATTPGTITPGTTTPGATVPTVACPKAGATIEPTTLSRTFAQSCAGCHGAAGGGIGKIPAIPGTITDFAKFREVVRGGQKQTMPAFSTDYVSDAELLRDFASLTKKAQRVPDGLVCTSQPELSSPQIENAIKAGLAMWRKPDEEGAACASCHGVEPFDLAIGGYDDATILRRSLLHISQDQAFTIIDYVKALRAKHGLAPRDPMQFRPFQPGGFVLGKEGAAPEENDHAFGLSLAQAAPTLGGARIDTLDKAKAAKDEMLALSPRTFPIAIALPRWTEDPHRGPDHASLNDWIPDRPRIPVDAAAQAKLYALHDAYIADPTVAKVIEIDEALDKLTKVVGLKSDKAAELFIEKYRAVLFAQHDFRMQALGKPGFDAMNPVAVPAGRNAAWHVGDFAKGNLASRDPIKNCVPDTEDGCLGLPKSSLEKLVPTATLADEMQKMLLPWFWLGWEIDHTLYYSGARGHTVSNSVTSSEYFTGELYNTARFYNHLTYMRLRKNLSIAYERGGAAYEDGDQRVAHEAAQNWGYFLAFGRGINDNAIPPAGEKRDLYARLLGNGMRMTMLLIIDEIAKSGKVYGKKSLQGSVPGTFKEFLQKHGGAVDADSKLMDQVTASLAGACDMSPAAKNTTDACK